jgi:hypothetical protein
MDNDRGYRQAIENIAWEIHRLSQESKGRGETTEQLVVTTVVNPTIAKEWHDLDAIIDKVTEIYQVGNETVQLDVLEVLKEYEKAVLPDRR